MDPTVLFTNIIFVFLTLIAIPVVLGICFGMIEIFFKWIKAMFSFFDYTDQQQSLAVNHVTHEKQQEISNLMEKKPSYVERSNSRVDENQTLEISEPTTDMDNALSELMTAVESIESVESREASVDVEEEDEMIKDLISSDMRVNVVDPIDTWNKEDFLSEDELVSNSESALKVENQSAEDVLSEIGEELELDDRDTKLIESIFELGDEGNTNETKEFSSDVVNELITNPPEIFNQDEDSVVNNVVPLFKEDLSFIDSVQESKKESVTPPTMVQEEYPTFYSPLPAQEFKMIKNKYGELIANSITTTPAEFSVNDHDTMIGRVEEYSNGYTLKYRKHYCSLVGRVNGMSEGDVVVVSGRFISPEQFYVEEYILPESEEQNASSYREVVGN